MWDEELDASVRQVKERMEEVWQLKSEVDAAKKIAEDLDKEYREQLESLRTLMEDYGLQRFDADGCFGSTKEQDYVTVPKDPESKRKLFQWLRDNGVFEDYATVNYQSLQSLWKEEREQGRDIPGLGTPRVRKTLVLYKQRNRKK